MDKLKIMISSTSELNCERAVLNALFTKYPNTELIGADPFNYHSTSSNSHSQTISFAKNCHLFILILGGKYGFELSTTNKSATETEFDAALTADPTKILVFQKRKIKIQPKQKEFISRVTDYFSGFWRVHYDNLNDFQIMADKTYNEWILKRAVLSQRFTYIDHFLRECMQIAANDLQVKYRIDDDHVGFTIQFANREKDIHFQFDAIRNKFWQCVSEFHKLSEALTR